MKIGTRLQYSTSTPDGGTVIVHVANEDPPKVRLVSKLLAWLGRKPAEFPTGTLLVLDSEACRERLRLDRWKFSHVELSEDGRALATTHEMGNSRKLCCWQVEKPLTFALGVPAGLGAVVVAFSWWRSRRKMQPDT